MKRTGIKTATRESVMDTIVKPISLDPLNAAWRGFSPVSMCRTIFSSITMASSTTKPAESVKAMRERLSTLYPRRYMTEKVPMMDIGSVKLGMIVADKFRRKRKITRTTKHVVRNRVNLTSFTESQIDRERSCRMSKFIEPGIWA